MDTTGNPPTMENRNEVDRKGARADNQGTRQYVLPSNVIIVTNMKCLLTAKTDLLACHRHFNTFVMR